MDIVLFGGLFIIIVLVLIGIAKYGIREKSYDDILKEKGLDASNITSNDAKKKVKKPKKTPQQQQQSKKQNKVETETDSESEQEEEKLVPVPDPFTNKVRSRKQAAVQQPIAKSANKTFADETGVLKSNSSSSVLSSASQQPQVKEIPKAVVKPNQASVIPKQQPKVVPLTNGDHENGEFIQQGKKPKQHVQHSDTEVKQNHQILKAAPVIEQQAAKPQPVLVNGHQQTAAKSLESEHNDQVVVKKELERASLVLKEKEKLVETLTHSNNKLKTDIET